MRGIPKLFVCLVALAVLALVLPPLAEACGGNGRTIAQLGGSCGGGSCSMSGGGGSPAMRAPITPAPVPEFAESTWSGSSTMTSPMRVAKPNAPRYAMQLPQASPAKTAVLTSTNGRDTLQMKSDVRPQEVPYTSSDRAVTTTTDGNNTKQMPSQRLALEVPAHVADVTKPVPNPDPPVSMRLTFRK